MSLKFAEWSDGEESERKSRLLLTDRVWELTAVTTVPLMQLQAAANHSSHTLLPSLTTPDRTILNAIREEGEYIYPFSTQAYPSTAIFVTTEKWNPTTK